MSDIAAWLAVIVGVAALAIAYVTYRSQRRITRLEFAVTTNVNLTPKLSSNLDIKVLFDSSVVAEPALTALRLVNTGDRPIKQDDFDTDIRILLEGSKQIASASVVGNRPESYQPTVRVDSGEISIAPTLINPGDMVEIQILTSGRVRRVKMIARISGLHAITQRNLPYSPGSGPEGELLAFDWFMWYVFSQIPIVGIVIILTYEGNLNIPAKSAIWTAAILIAFALNPLYVKRLIRRRRMWNTEEPSR